MKRGFLLFGLMVALAGCGGGFAVNSGTLSIAGRWSGPFQSNDTSFPRFTVTAVINQGTNGSLTAVASFTNSPCISNANLKGRIAGLNVSLAGSDSAGDNVTFNGTTNSSGTQMSLAYIINAGASGRCETDSGMGTLSR